PGHHSAGGLATPAVPPSRTPRDATMGLVRLSSAAELEPRLRRLLPAISLLTLCLWAPLVVPARHSWDDADPELLDTAYRLSQGLPLSRKVESLPWIVNPYPPFYPLPVAGGLKIGGLSYTPARVVSLLATLAVAAALVLFPRNGQRRARE